MKNKKEIGAGGGGGLRRRELGSTSGGCVFHHGVLLTTWSRTQPTVTLSTAEAELYAMGMAVQAALSPAGGPLRPRLPSAAPRWNHNKNNNNNYNDNSSSSSSNNNDNNSNNEFHITTTNSNKNNIINHQH